MAMSWPWFTYVQVLGSEVMLQEDADPQYCDV